MEEEDLVFMRRILLGGGEQNKSYPMPDWNASEALFTVLVKRLKMCLGMLFNLLRAVAD